MENYSYFYQAVTKIAQDRIKELVQHARDAEAEGNVFPQAGLYFLGCAQTVYLTWCDITEGWQTDNDRKLLQDLVGFVPWRTTELDGKTESEPGTVCEKDCK